MGLSISPKDSLDGMDKGEEISYTLDVTDELGTNTVNSVAYAIYNDKDEPVTSNYSGGYSESDGVITFGVIAHDTGSYRLEFIITCNEYLPDGTTLYEFYVNMTVIIS
jgi:hypothetical protein